MVIASVMKKKKKEKKCDKWKEAAKQNTGVP